MVCKSSVEPEMEVNRQLTQSTAVAIPGATDVQRQRRLSRGRRRMQQRSSASHDHTASKRGTARGNVYSPFPSHPSEGLRCSSIHIIAGTEEKARSSASILQPRHTTHSLQPTQVQRPQLQQHPSLPLCRSGSDGGNSVERQRRGAVAAKEEGGEGAVATDSRLPSLASSDTDSASTRFLPFSFGPRSDVDSGRLEGRESSDDSASTTLAPSSLPLGPRSGNRRVHGSGGVEETRNGSNPLRQLGGSGLTVVMPPPTAKAAATTQPTHPITTNTAAGGLGCPPSSSPSPPCSPDQHTSNSAEPSASYLYLYRHLPPVSSQTDLERLGRSMQGLVEGGYYYPDLDSDGARALLTGDPEGSFLVRDSSDPKFLFALTVKTARGATSVRIQYQRGFFQLDCEEEMKRKLPRFETLLELVDFHVLLSRDRQGGAQYRWLEPSRRKDMAVRLTAPRRQAAPSLAHLARLTVNQSLEDLHLPSRSTDLLPLPPALKSYLRAHPHKV